MTTSVLRWAAAGAILPVLAFAQLVTNVCPGNGRCPFKRASMLP